jgi:hypothetical protein
MKPFTATSVVLLALIAVGHLLRVLAGWDLLVGATIILAGGKAGDSA